jgi:hypothetical protein
MENHEKVNDLLTDFVLGELSLEQKAEVESHLNKCRVCNDEVKRIHALFDCTEKIRAQHVDDNACISARQTLLRVVENEKATVPNYNKNNTARKVGSKIMKKQITKIAVAAGIIIAAFVAIHILSNSNNQPTPLANNLSTQTNSSDDNRARSDTQQQLRKIEQYAAAVNVEGLISMLNYGQFQSKVAAAKQLGKIGDQRALPALEKLYLLAEENPPAGYTENPFASAIEAIKNANASTLVDSGMVESAAMDTNSAQQANQTELSAKELLNLMPSDCLVCIKLNNFDYTLGMIDQYLAGISPVPFGATMAARMQLAGALASPTLNGVDTAGSFAIIALPLSQKDKTATFKDIFIAGLIPVADYNKFVDENPNYEVADTNGISIIKAGGAVNPDKKMLVAQLGNYALLCQGSDYTKLLTTVKAISSNTEKLSDSLEPDEIADATTQPLWIYCNTRKASKVFEPVIYAKLDEMKNQIKQMNQSGQTTVPDAVMNMYFGMLDIIVNEVRAFTLTVNPKPDTLTIKTNTAAVEGTYLAKMFATDTTNLENQYLGYLNDGAAMNIGLKINPTFWEEWLLSNFDLISFLSDEGISNETLAKLEKLMSDMMSCFGSSGAVCLGPESDGKCPFPARYVFEVKNAELWHKTEDNFAELWNKGGFVECYRKIGVETNYSIERGIENYKGVSIDSAKFAMKPADANSDYGKIITSAYGEGLDYRWALLNGLSIGVMGSDCNAVIAEETTEIHKIIDEVLAGTQKQIQPEMAAALSMLTNGETADMVGTYNLVRYLRMAGGMMSAFNPSGSAMMNIDTPTTTNIAFAARVKNHKLSFEFALPKQHILEIKAAAEQMQKAFEVINANSEAGDAETVADQNDNNIITGDNPDAQ